MPFDEPIIGKPPILTELGDAAFNAEFRKAAESQLGVLIDGRPGIIKGRLMGALEIVTLLPIAWEVRKSRYLAKHLPVGSHERGCSTCGCKMELTRELESTWSFRCPVCKTVDTWGKHIIGGTLGGGEKEKT